MFGATATDDDGLLYSINGFSNTVSLTAGDKIMFVIAYATPGFVAPVVTELSAFKIRQKAGSKLVITKQ